MYFLSISKCWSPVEYAALYIFIFGQDRQFAGPFGLITVQIMTEELAYNSLIAITMSINTKSWIFGLTESADFGVSKHFSPVS